MIKSAVATTKDPLAPQVLNQAGVPLEDALWLNRIPPARKVQALRQPRGEKILDCVRAFIGVQTAMADMAREPRGGLMTA